MATNQGQLQQWLRDQTGTVLNFNGDMLAFLSGEGIDISKGYNGALYEYLQNATGLTGDVSLTDLQHEFAIQNGFDRWTAVTSLSSEEVINSWRYFSSIGSNPQEWQDLETGAPNESTWQELEA